MIGKMKIYQKHKSNLFSYVYESYYTYIIVTIIILYSLIMEFVQYRLHAKHKRSFNITCQIDFRDKIKQIEDGISDELLTFVQLFGQKFYCPSGCT